MTPEQKAKELVEKFKDYAYTDWHGGADEMTNEIAAKECAIICCNEIIDVLGGEGVYSFADEKVSLFWEKTKEEILKL